MTRVACTVALGAMTLIGCADVVVEAGAIRPDAPQQVAAPITTTANVPVPVQPCPTARPRDDANCDVANATCEYGESPDVACNVLMRCSNEPGRWRASANASCAASACPSREDVALRSDEPCELAPRSDAGASDADEVMCPSLDGVCVCTTGRDAAHSHERKWVCSKTPPECPITRPLLGQRCQGALSCNYGACAAKRGVVMECVDGIWLMGAPDCP